MSRYTLTNVKDVTVRLAPYQSFTVRPTEAFSAELVFGEEGSGNGKLSNPYGIAVNSVGTEILVADYGNNRIARFSNGGTWVGSFGTSGSGNGQLNGPTDVSIIGGYIYVVDSGNKRIQRFNASTFAYVSQWAFESGYTPYGICGDVVLEKVYVVGKSDSDTTGVFVRTNLTGTVGNVRKLVYYPTSCCLAKDDTYIVLGVPNFGTYVLRVSDEKTVYSNRMTTGGDIGYVSIAVDDSDFLYYADDVRNQVLKFDGIFGFRSSAFGGFDGEDFVLGGPRGVVHYRDYFYVSDYENHQIIKVTSGSRTRGVVLKIDNNGTVQYVGGGWFHLGDGE